MSTNGKSAGDVVITGAARTPTGRFLGGLSSLSAPQLGSHAIEAAVAQSGIAKETIYEVIMGHVVAAGVGQAPARIAALGANLEDTVGASSVNKVCGSGLKSVMLASNAIRAGEASVMVAGGMESLSQAPYVLPKARTGMKYGHGEVKDTITHDGLWCAFENWVMGNAAEFIGRKFEITREEVDQFALSSHDKAAAATAAGRFMDEIVPVEIKGRRGKVTRVEHDEPIRATFENGGYTLTTNAATLGKLRPAFEEDGIVTAGNAPGLNDGGAAVVMMSREEAERQGSAPLARVVGYTLAGVAPQWIFSAPARAIPKLLERIGWSVNDVDLFEINEAFAAQVLANKAELEQRGLPLDMSRVNVNGGAIALGHPLGASGNRLLVTLIYALKQRNLKRGVAALCLGGGEAVALAIEVE